jgi:hypothetical protein
MKAETKGKRRVTLSICGLAMLDELEVETIPDAIKTQVPELKPATPEVWRKWEHIGDALVWASSILPDKSMAELQKLFDSVPAVNGKKAPALLKKSCPWQLNFSSFMSQALVVVRPSLGNNYRFVFHHETNIDTRASDRCSPSSFSTHQQYVQWTEHHQHQAQGLPPCAIHLWQYLLYKYPGGVPQEIDLEEIRVEISGGRSKNYCVQSLKNALWKYLVPRGLVAVVKQFTANYARCC